MPIRTKEKSNEEIKIGIVDMKIEGEKTQLDRYIKTIVRSAFSDNVTSGAYFNGLYHDMMLRGYEAIDKPGIPDKDRWDLRRELIPLFYKFENILEEKEHTLAYYKRMNGFAKAALVGLNDKKKELIIMDCIEQQTLWSDQFNRNSKVYKKVEEFEKKSKKPTKKPTKKKNGQTNKRT